MACTIVFFMVHSHLSAQTEVLTPLKINRQLINAKRVSDINPGTSRAKKNKPRTRKLPFFEDFSKSKNYPSDTMWMDYYVWINNTMAIHPPSAGVATFDGLNEHGRAYAAGTGFNEGQPCDTLTSMYIDLSTLKEKDSVYLSFFYQSTGNGEQPDPTDSLVLEFKPDSIKGATGTYDSTKWIKIWSKTSIGLRKDSFYCARFAVRGNPAYNLFHKRFQFRLRNYANASGTLDAWNVDYIYMAQGRSAKDTSFNDAAIYFPAGSILKNYYTMPWNHFIADSANNKALNLNVYVRNNGNATKNVTFGYDIYNNANGQLLGNDASNVARNVNPFGTTIKSFTPIRLGKSPLPASADYVDLKIRTYEFANPDFFRTNDTGYQHQIFSNVFAYDDGSAEVGYFLAGSALMEAAVRFTLNIPDSLYGVGIHLNESITDISQKNLDIAVWDKISPIGQPAFDKASMSLAYQFPKYVDSLNGFYYYEFPKPYPIKNQVYIGWIQREDYSLNIGMDLNYPLINGAKSNSNFFVNPSGSWQTTTVKGAPMIHAYVGKKPKFPASIEKQGTENKELIANLFPNPSSGQFNLTLPAQGDYSLYLMNMSGQQQDFRTSQKGQISLDYTSLNKGVYILQIRDNKNAGVVIFKKLVIY